MRSVRHIQHIYCLILAIFWFSTALPLAILVLIHQSRGLDLFEVGILMGAYSLTIVLLEVPTGGLADAVGRKRVTQFSYALSFISGLVFLFAFDFPAFLLAWILNGISRALGSGALDAWFIDALHKADPDMDIQPSLAKAGTVTLLALGLGTLIGGALPQLFSGLPTEGTAILTPLTTTLVFAGILNSLLLAMVTLLIHEDWPLAVANGWKSSVTQIPEILHDTLILTRSNKTILALLLAAIVGGIGLASIETFWQPRFDELLNGIQGSTIYFGVVMAVSFLVGAMGNLASIPLSRLLKGRYGLITGLIQGIQGLAFILLAFQSNFLSAAAFFWVIYLTIGGKNSPYATLINNEIPDDRRSSMLSVQSLANYIGGFLGSVILGYIAKNYSISFAWTIAGFALLVSLPLYMGMNSHPSKQAKRYDSETAIL